MSANNNIMLEVKDLTIRFGGLVAVNAVNFAVPTGSVFGLIGPNAIRMLACNVCAAQMTHMLYKMVPNFSKEAGVEK